MRDIANALGRDVMRDWQDSTHFVHWKLFDWIGEIFDDGIHRDTGPIHLVGGRRLPQAKQAQAWLIIVWSLVADDASTGPRSESSLDDACIPIRYGMSGTCERGLFLTLEVTRSSSGPNDPRVGPSVLCLTRRRSPRSRASE